MDDTARGGRCVVWFGQPIATEQQSLANSGWSVRVANVQAREGVGVRAGQTVVAMADFRHGDDNVLQAMGRQIAQYPRVPWIALVSSEMPTQQPLVKGILLNCAELFTAPSDMPRLLETLARFSDSKQPQLAMPEADTLGMVGQSAAML